VRSAFGIAVAASLLAPGPASSQAVRDSARSEMDGFAAALETAVRKVSRPSPAMLVGREGARSYRLSGFGAVFVLAPRALPAASRRSASEREAARSVDQAIHHLEMGLRTAPSAEARKQMEKSLEALRQTQADLRDAPADRTTSMILVSPAQPDFVLKTQLTAEGDVGEMRLQELQRELEAQMADQMRVLEEVERVQDEHEQDMARGLEIQAREWQARIEAVRRDAERARAAAERQIEQRLADAPVAVSPAAPVAPPAPAAPVEVSPPAPDSAPPVAAPPIPFPAPAPWQFWFRTEDPGDNRSGEAVVRDVKAAVTAIIEQQGASLHLLRPEEYVAVAVDFIPRGPLVPGDRVQKTLVIKVRKRDLDEHRAGRLAADALRQRFDYTEY